MPEYSRFKDLEVEIQVRTILQHAWAEIEHDIGYKSSQVIPGEVRRRFAALAGMLEVADREFESIQVKDSDIRVQAIDSLKKGLLNTVEISPYALKAYLDKKLGYDFRMTDFSYEWEATTLRELGFKNFEQIDKCIEGYDHDKISRIVTGGRQGQLSRFEMILAAGMGESYMRLHQSKFGWVPYYAKLVIPKLKEAGLEVGSYSPENDAASK